MSKIEQIKKMAQEIGWTIEKAGDAWKVTPYSFRDDAEERAFTVSLEEAYEVIVENFCYEVEIEHDMMARWS